MIRPRWRKVLRDLWGNKLRTTLVVLSIAIGVFAVGMIVGTQILLREDLSQVYGVTNPAHAFLSLSPFDEEAIEIARSVAGVAEADGRAEHTIPLQKEGDELGEIRLTVPADFSDWRLQTVAPVSGKWPPEEREILLERASVPYVNAAVGETITVEDVDGRLRQLTIVGVGHDLFTQPVQFTNVPNGYITRETAEWLGYGDKLSRMPIRITGDDVTEEEIRAVVNRVKLKLEKAGYAYYGDWIPEPGEHPANEAVQPLLAILGILGLLSLFASAFLVINIINGLLAQHTTQIGIMKAIGARSSQVMGLYMASVLIFGLLSLLIAVPLGALAAYGLADFIAGFINFDLNGVRLIPQVALLQTAVAILVPVLAALVPVLRGTAITVRQALSEQGLGAGHFGSSLIDRAMNWLTAVALRLSRPTRISLRNTIRRKARLLLTLITLTLGGAIFIGVLTVHESLLKTLDDALAYFAYDIDVEFKQAHRLEEIQRQVMQVPGVAAAESWIGASAVRLRPDGEEGEGFYLIGAPADTAVINPTLLDGRWLEPDDSSTIVLNSLVLKDEPDIQVGDEITLKVNGREEDWRVVGLVQGVMTGGIGYVNQPYLARLLRFVDKADSVEIVAATTNPAAQRALEIRLRQHLEEAGMAVDSTGLISDVRGTIEYQFGLVVTLLAVMAVLVALVGGLGLTGTMSINVLERTREIGVMRAVGASDTAVQRIVMVEGALVGVISWFFAILLAIPISHYLSNVVGNELLRSSLSYTFSFKGAFIWLVAVIIIGALASFWPAWNASRLSVRETLAYE
ncbi:MAG: FtsX-like permease family protein [Chloroflexi bacterium]|nr:FtsX-like permease family protein [Chloroflexota bacterium]